MHGSPLVPWIWSSVLCCRDKRKYLNKLDFGYWNTKRLRRQEWNNHENSFSWKTEFMCGSVQLILSCPTFWNPMDYSTPGLPVCHQLPELTQTHVHWVSDAIQPSHPLLSPSPPAFSLSQHQCLFQWVNSSHQVVKVLELQLQHQSFQRIIRTDFL